MKPSQHGLSRHDELLLQRFHDGELDAAAAADCRRRLAAEPALRAGLDALVAMSGMFRAGADAGFAAPAAGRFAAPAGFAAQVLAETRRLPDRIRLREAETASRAAVLCRRILLAAIVLIGLGLVWQTGLFSRGGSDVLTASPDEVDREMDRLDAIIQSWHAAKESRHR